MYTPKRDNETRRNLINGINNLEIIRITINDHVQIMFVHRKVNARNYIDWLTVRVNIGCRSDTLFLFSINQVIGNKKLGQHVVSSIISFCSCLFCREGIFGKIENLPITSQYAESLNRTVEILISEISTSNYSL